MNFEENPNDIGVAEDTVSLSKPLNLHVRSNRISFAAILCCTVFMVSDSGVDRQDKTLDVCQEYSRLYKEEAGSGICLKGNDSEAFEKVLSKLNESDQDAAISLIGQYTHLVNSVDPLLVLELLDKFKNQPWAGMAVRGSYQNNPSTTIDFIFSKDAFNEEWAKPIIEKALDDPDARIINYLYKVQSWPNFENMTVRAIRSANSSKYPEDILYGLDLLDDADKILQNSDVADIVKTAAFKISESNPDNILGGVDIIKNQSYFTEVLDKAIQSALKGDLYTLVIYFESYRHRSDAEIIFEKAVRILAQRTESNHFLNVINQIADRPYANELINTYLNNILIKHPDWIMRSYDLMAKLPDAPDWLKKAIERDPFYYLERVPEFNKILGSEASLIETRCRDMVKKTDKALDLPDRKINSDQFISELEEMHLYLMRLNYEMNKNSRIGYKRGDSLISMPLQQFETVFLSQAYQDFLKGHDGQITYMNAISLAQAVIRNLEKSISPLPLDYETIKKTTENLFESADQIRSLEIFGPNVKLIVTSNAEARYKNDEILKNLYHRAGGTAESVVFSGKGVEIQSDKNNVKTMFLGSIFSSDGPTTIVFNGHGIPDSWLLKSDQKTEEKITFQELGDALIASGDNIENIRLIGMACFAYDFFSNLFDYLDSKGEKRRPILSISGANKDKKNRGGGRSIDAYLLDQIFENTKEGKAVTAGDFMDAENKVWIYEDPAFFIYGKEVL